MKKNKKVQQRRKLKFISETALQEIVESHNRMIENGKLITETVPIEIQNKLTEVLPTSLKEGGNLRNFLIGVLIESVFNMPVKVQKIDDDTFTINAIEIPPSVSSPQTAKE